jgi:AraC-like DNA-binding protein
MMIEPTICERHYRVDEISAMWNMSSDTVRRLFSQESGVVRYGRPRCKYKRSYTTLLIPESVLTRVYRRITSAV